MSLASLLRSWLRRARRQSANPSGPRKRPLLEALEDRCVPASAVGVFSPATGAWYIHEGLTSGAPTVGPFAYGGADWAPLAGDWDGDGVKTIGVFNPHTASWY